jgi:hypothetical protein
VLRINTGLVTRDWDLFKSCWFIVALALLLLNDFLLKALYGNVLTGKISDFAGLFVFPLFWTCLLPKHKAKIFWFTFIFFIFWKSPFSQTFIGLWNANIPIQLHRTVDYTDLIALAILPLAYQFHSHRATVRLFDVNPAVPLIVCAFAFVATSYRTAIPLNSTYQFKLSKDTIISRIDALDSLSYGRELSFSKNDSDTVDLTIPSSYCFTAFEVRIAVTKVNDNVTELTVLSAEHKCPEGARDKEELIKEFESAIVRRIRD